MDREMVVNGCLAGALVSINVACLLVFGFGDRSIQGTLGLVQGVLAGILFQRIWGR